MTDLIVEGVKKQLGQLQILHGASFRADRGKIFALLGASGSGKTTLLRCIAGLEQPESGRIVIAGDTVLDAERGIVLSPERRNIGLVFQSYALWPHRTVRDNVGYGLKLRGIVGEAARPRVDMILGKLGLAHLAERFPDQLSGGQQQRVAICRALVYEPKILLMDEPLSNLDAKLREEARYWIRKLILELDICAVLVTHDQSEALAMADHVLLLKDGVIVQEGRPLDVYSRPTSFYAAEFLGANNVLEGKVAALGEGGRVTIEGGGFRLPGIWRDEVPPSAGQAARAVVRVERIAVSATPVAGAIELDLDACLYLGDHWEYRLRRQGLSLRARGPGPLDQPTVWCALPEDAVWVFASA